MEITDELDSSGRPIRRLKIGDGISTWQQLPYDFDVETEKRRASAVENELDRRISDLESELAEIRKVL